MRVENGVITMKRVFLIVLDSVGVGEMPDAAAFGDQGSHTVYAASHYDGFYMPNMQKLGFFNLDGMKVDEKHAWAKEKVEQTGTICRLSEKSKGKDTTTGHWEIAGLISREAMPTFPNGFPKDLIDQFEKRTGRKVLCNKPYSGTEVIKDYGKSTQEEASQCTDYSVARRITKSRYSSNEISPASIWRHHSMVCASGCCPSTSSDQVDWRMIHSISSGLIATSQQIISKTSITRSAAECKLLT